MKYKFNPKRLESVSIVVAYEKGSLLEKVVDSINSNLEIKTLWEVININAIERLKMTNHGWSHFQLVAQTALQMVRIFEKAGIQSSCTRDYGLTQDHAEVVIFLASVMHDLGMSINRSGHEEYSLMITRSLCLEILDFLPIAEKTIITSEVLHAIISHRKDGRPLTVEAGIVRVADALDMTKGRTRIPMEEGTIDIHTVSALAIESVEISTGQQVPIQINVVMNHTAGIFQVDELLKNKIEGSGIEQYLDVDVYIIRKGHKVLFKNFYKRTQVPEFSEN